jgi:hypothetical protein
MLGGRAAFRNDFSLPERFMPPPFPLLLASPLPIDCDALSWRPSTAATPPLTPLPPNEMLLMLLPPGTGGRPLPPPSCTGGGPLSRSIAPLPPPPMIIGCKVLGW